MNHAITLSGGGAYGAFEVGVLKALMGGQAPIMGGEALDPTVFTGTSAGAYLSAVLLSADAADPAGRAGHLERVWLEHVIDSPRRDGNGVWRLSRASVLLIVVFRLQRPMKVDAPAPARKT